MARYDSLITNLEAAAKDIVLTDRYILGVEKVRGCSSTPLVAMVGYSVGTPEIVTRDRVTVPIEILRNGERISLNYTARSEQVLEYTLQIGVPANEFLKVAAGRVLASLDKCPRDIFVDFLCPSDCGQSHFWRLPSARRGPLTPTDLITVGDTAQPVTMTFNVYSTQLQFYQCLRASLVQDITAAIYTIGYCGQLCVSCTIPNEDGFYGGAQALPAAFTDDGFATGTATAALAAAFAAHTPAIATYVITSHICRSLGTVTVGTWANTADPATATDGGVWFTQDGGNSFTVIDLNAPLFDISEFGGMVIAVGSGGAIRTSVDFSSWTTVTNTLTTEDLYAVDYDATTTIAYIVGGDANTPVFLSLKGVFLSDLTSELPVTVVTGLRAVEVLEPKHVAIGSAGGQYIENCDVSSNEYAFSVVTTVADPVVVIKGDSAQTIFGAGNVLYNRSNLTEREFVVLENVPGTNVTGNYTSGDEGITPGQFSAMNYFIFATDLGEIVAVQPELPIIDIVN